MSPASPNHGSPMHAHAHTPLSADDRQRIDRLLARPWFALAGVAQLCAWWAVRDEAGAVQTAAFVAAAVLWFVPLVMWGRFVAAPHSSVARTARVLALVAMLGLMSVALLFVGYAGEETGAGSHEVLRGTAVLLLVSSSLLWLALWWVTADLRIARAIDVRRVFAAARTALVVVLALAALGVLNWSMHRLDWRRDFSFAAPTTPSAATQSVLELAACSEQQALPEVFLFFERGSTALAEVRDYFDALAHIGVPVLTLDQASDPALSKAVKVTKNGTIAVRCGQKSETLSLGDTREDAQRKLKKLDEDMRTRLHKVVRDPKVIYVTTGNGERSLDDAGQGQEGAPLKLLKRLIESTNAKVKKLGLAEGAALKVPDDAGLVLVLSPTRPLLPETTNSLVQYVNQGGSLWLTFDPLAAANDGDNAPPPVAPLLAALSLVSDFDEVLNDKEFVQRSNTPADWAFIFSTQFGSHPSVKGVAAQRGKAAVIFNQAAAIEKATTPLPGQKASLISRTRPASFKDHNHNRRADDGEARNVFDVAAAVEVGEGERVGRAFVVGDTDFLADAFLPQQANAAFAYDALLWLLRDDDKVGDALTLDEDVEITHTRSEDKAWFIGTLFLAPALVMLVGVVVVRRRHRRRRPVVAMSSKGEQP